MSALIETPNRFAPRSVLLDFPARSEGDPNPARQEAAANVRKMLAEKDRREAAASAKKNR